MAFPLGDIFIGSFPVTQTFGSRPEIYQARFNLRGHNGVDFGCPTMTPILATADGIVQEIGFDAAGYGKYIKIKHQGFLSLYGHLNDTVVNLKDLISAGQLIAHSNNSGFSDAPHLHFGIAPCDENGIKLDPQNGYSGYIDPLNEELCKWEIKNLTEPVVPHPVEDEASIAVPAKDFPVIVAQGANYKAVANYCIQNGMNNYLTDHNLSPLDLVQNPGDPEGGNKITAYIQALLKTVEVLRQTPTSPPPQIAGQTLTDLAKSLSPANKESFIQQVTDAVKKFIFVQQ